MKHLCTLIIGVLLAPAVFAATAVDERRPVEPGATLNFEAVAGSVEIIATEGSEFVMTGQIADHIRELSITGDASDWSIEVEPRDTNGWNWRNRDREVTFLEIRLPADVNLDIQTVSGAISITGMEPEHMDLESVSGSITANDSGTAALDAESVSGNIEISGGGRQATDLSSVSGNIRADRVSGSLSVETVSGNATISGDNLDEADFETVSGGFDLDLGMNATSELDISSHSGEITVRLPAGLPIRFDAETFSGRIINGFDPDHSGDARSQRFTSGAGTAELDIETFSGTIRIEPRE